MAMLLPIKFVRMVLTLLLVTLAVYFFMANTGMFRELRMKTLNITNHVAPLVYLHESSHDVTNSCVRQVDMNRVHVTIMSDRKEFVGMLTLANSILKNTRSDVMFHFVTFPGDVPALREWIAGSNLRTMSYRIVTFDRHRLEGRVIFIDADCLVLGDIEELYNVRLEHNHVLAGLNMCHTDYHPRPVSGLVLNKTNRYIKAADVPMDVCMMNGGVYVADLMKWQALSISSQLQYWMELNTREQVFKYGDHGSGSQAVLIAALYNKYSAIPIEWNVINGMHSKIHDAKLIHWNGGNKPWKFRNSHSAKIWATYEIVQPTEDDETSDEDDE